jgi:hypothetical protein
MDIHKPKAAHGLREFAVEIGTIICGILIALSLEQAVEWSHARHEMSEAREAIAGELAFDVGSIRLIASQDACIDARLDLLDAWADGKAQIETAHLASIDNRPLLRNLRLTAWEIAKTGAVAAHMSVADRMAYAGVYEALTNQLEITQAERRAWLEFGRYAGKGALDRDEARRLKEDVGMARADASGRRLNAPGIEAAVARLGTKSGPLPPFPKGRGPRDLCGPPV